MAALTARGRRQVKRGNYAVPKGVGSRPGVNQYPIHDAAHARNALSRVAQHGTPAERRRVRRAVTRKYPSIGKPRRGRRRRSRGS